MMTQRHVVVHAILIDCSKSEVFEIPSPERTCLVRHLSNKRSRIRQLYMKPKSWMVGRLAPLVFSADLTVRWSLFLSSLVADPNQTVIEVHRTDSTAV